MSFQFNIRCMSTNYYPDYTNITLTSTQHWYFDGLVTGYCLLVNQKIAVLFQKMNVIDIIKVIIFLNSTILYFYLTHNIKNINYYRYEK